MLQPVIGIAAFVKVAKSESTQLCCNRFTTFASIAVPISFSCTPSIEELLCNGIGSALSQRMMTAFFPLESAAASSGNVNTVESVCLPICRKLGNVGVFFNVSM